ncbi:hypothetical protein FRX31_006748 [Thalictrum thalictroides]|uniref:RNase H type-1 domain-containing protein n=1 Tax=Thalictrum thalictroides TaxID=46969 RepID=A0A7J6X1W7_THATH|nr:hypothetical protein FRX31_006748 [Thalictrum thalictroides]
MFFKCTYSKIVWDGVNSLLGIVTDTRSSNWEWESMFKLCRTRCNLSEIIATYTCATVRFIWIERNNRRFNNVSQTATVVRARLLKEIKIYLQTQLTMVKDNTQLRACVKKIGLVLDYKQKDAVHCSWEKPKREVFKINTDRSVREEGAGYGGLVRDSEGNMVVGFSCASSIKSVMFQELQAILKRLVGASFMRLQAVVVESDSLRAIQCILKKEKPPWFCEDMVVEIQMRAQGFQIAEFKHNFRETNKAADYLAGQLGVVDICNFFVNHIDEKLVVILKEDSDGKLYTRLLS